MLTRRRTTRAPRRFAGILLLVAIAFGLLVALPAIARDRVERVLTILGAHTPRFDIRSVSLGRLRLANLDTGPSDWLVIDRVEVDYGIGSILGGEVQTIELDGAQWRITVDGGHIDMGFRPQLDGHQPADLPFKVISLRNSTLLLDWNGHVLRFGIEGRLTRRAADSLRIDLDLTAPDGLTIPWNGLAINQFQANINLHADVRPGELRLYDLSLSGNREFPSSIQAEGVRLHHSGGAVSVVHPAFRITQPASRPLLRIAYGAHQEPGLWLDAQVEALRDLSYQTSAGDGFIEDYSAQLQLRVPQTEPLTVDAEVSIADASYRLDSAALALSGIAVTIPITVNVPAGEPGRVSIASITTAGVNWPSLTGTIQAADNRIEAEAIWPFALGAVASAAAWTELGPYGLRGELSANVPTFDFDKSSLSRLHSLIPALAGANVGGAWRGEAHVSFEGGRIQPRARLAAENASIAHPDWPARVQSATGEITFDGFAPLSMPGAQRVDIAAAQVGDLEVREAKLIFALENPASLTVQEASWSMRDFGLFQAAPFRIDPRNPRIETQLYCEDASLDQWLNLLSDGRVRGQGTLVGSIEFSIDPTSEYPLNFGRGLLYADPPIGRISTRDPRAIADLVEQGNWEFGSSQQAAQVRDRVVDALSDFQFSLLRCELTPSGDKVRCRVHTVGTGRASAGGQELDLTLNLNSFDLLLRAAILGKSIWNLRE